jgi:hypothetical protein
VIGGRLGSRGLTQLRDRLSERDLAVIGQVASLKLMSGRQIERIHFGVDQHATVSTAARTARRVLERLVDDRLLARLDRRVGGVRAGSASFVYGLGPIGQRVLGLGGPRRRIREPTATFVAHTLAIAELVVGLTLADRRRDLELLQVQTEPECWRRLGARGLVILRPDLFVITANGDFEYRYFIEVDLGTESLPRLLAKCRIYEDYYRAGAEQHLHDVFPSVLWIMHNEARTLKLRGAIDRSSSLSAEVFMVTTDSKAFNVLVGAAVGGPS